MNESLIDAIAAREAAREEAQYGIEATPERLADLARSLAATVADVLDILSQDGRILAPVEPGLCWHNSGITWPNEVSPRCELRAGHAGAHECDRGSMGGTAVWTEWTTPTTRRETEPETDQPKEGEHA